MFGFDPFTSTEKACPNSDDAEVVSQLQISNTKEEKGNNLYFYDWEGNQAVVLKKVEKQPPV